MRKSILFLLLNLSLLLSINISFGQLKNRINWVNQKSGTTENLYSVYFPTVIMGYAVGGDTLGNSIILKTIDGGSHWTIQHKDTTGSLYSVFVYGPNGWAVGWSGTIIRTIDGGSTWFNQSLTYTNNLNCVYFTSLTTGYIVGDKGLYLTTSDTGHTWSTPRSLIKQNLGAIIMNGANGYIVGDSGKILFSTNTGSNWSVQKSHTSYYLHSVTNFVSGNYVYTCGGYNNNGIVDETISPKADYWSVVDVGVTASLNSVDFFDPSTGFVAGGNGTILKTTNYGIDWLTLTSGTTENLNSICFPADQELTGFAVGDSGVIVKTTDGGANVGINEIAGQKSNLTSEIYPNPVNNKALINYHIPEKCFVTIKVYNLVGKDIMTLANEEKDMGDYSTEFNSENLENGIYFYEIRAGENIITNKIVINK